MTVAAVYDRRGFAAPRTSQATKSKLGVGADGTRQIPIESVATTADEVLLRHPYRGSYS
jgi:hypothetical protein